MKRFQKLCAAFLAVLLSLSALACTRVESGGGDTVIPIVTSVPEGYVPSDASGAKMELSETPEPTPTEQSSTEFHALDREIFIRYITDSGYTYHQMLADSAAYDLSSENVTMSFGDFSVAADAAYAAECAEYLSRLLEIPRAELNERDQLSYDVLQQYLETASPADTYDYFYEPLSQYGGLQTQIPLALGLFEFRDEQDIIDYLALTADVPRYFAQILAYEQERAAQGMFMTEEALTCVLRDCKDVIDAGDTFYLIATFGDGVDSVAGLSAQDAESYKADNKKLVSENLIGAYRTLYDGLSALKSACSEPLGLCRMNVRGADYFEVRMQQESDSVLSIEEMLDSLRDELFYMIAMCAEISESGAKKAGALTSGSTESDLALLEMLSKRILFALPEHTLRISTVPEELEGQLSGAAFVIPPIDDWSDCEVLLNPAQQSGDTLVTLAHEAYPGHLFQYVYQRSLSDTGLMQRALHFGGYSEGWAQTAALLAVQNQSLLDSSACEAAYYDDMVQNVLLPAIVSIYVNYYSYDEASVKSFLQSLNFVNDQNAAVYYSLAVNMPFYYLSYACGYCQLAQMLRGAEEDMGDSFDRSAYLAAYLDLGPAYFNIVQERMDVWVDAHTPE